MCNAWNHSLNCTCGWGGEGHAGRRSYFGHVNYSSWENTYWWVPPFSNNYESYVNPNALCPVCGALVFFYQSPSGGRVFFDELGPPWPKHPCTDNRSIPQKIVYAETVTAKIASSTRQYSWQEEGWVPLLIASTYGIDKDFLKVIGTYLGEEIYLYTHRLVEHHHHDESISPKSVALARKLSELKYEISIITESGAPSTIYAFTLLSEARSDCKEKAKINIQDLLAKNKVGISGSGGKNSSDEGLRIRQPAIGGKSNSMRLAFERAQAKNNDK